MALYYITGLAGTGKSEVCTAFQNSGQEAIDSDLSMARWVRRKSGYVHPKSSVKAADRTPEFLGEHDWKVPREEVALLAEQALGKTVFLCGVGGNEHEIRDLFDGMFALVVDEATLVHRLKTRKTNDWGKSPDELALTLSWQEPAYKDYQKYGHVLIDATQPVYAVIEEILTHVEANGTTN